MKKLEKYLIDDEIFRTSLLLFMNCTAEEFLAELSKYQTVTNDDLEGIKESIIQQRAAGMFSRIDNDKYHFNVIWVGKENQEGTLVHELTHFVHSTFEQKNIPLSRDTDEVYAYFIEAIFNKIQKLRKKKHIHKKR